MDVPSGGGQTGAMRAHLVSATMLLTRIPVQGWLGRGTPAPAADAAWAWPVVGGLVGLAGGLAAWGAATLGLAPGLAAALGVAVPTILTGALHEDGLADCADGWGGRDPARRLEIMRDSRVGSFGVVALVLALLAKWSLVGAALATPAAAPWTLAAAAAAGRAAMPALMRLPPARADGLSRGIGAPTARVAGLAAALAALALLPFGPRGALALLLAALTAWGIAALARRRLGGQTGDVLGAAAVLCEIAALAALTVA